MLADVWGWIGFGIVAFAAIVIMLTFGLTLMAKRQEDAEKREYIRFRDEQEGKRGTSRS